MCKCEHFTESDFTSCYLKEGKSALDNSSALAFGNCCLGCKKTQKEILKEQTIESLGWMIADMKWRADEVKQNLEAGSQGDYSPELTKAISLLARWKEE